jgi:1-deoxy-D-xylulose-5-phosphate reductoisomerase
MGVKITVDSATLMNKGFEIIEAKWLFDADPDEIDVIVHRESIIHSMVEYKDNMIIAQLGAPDMRSCIQYALTAPERIDGIAESLDFAKLAKMTFFAPDEKTFPLLSLAKQVLKKGGCYGASLNGANEEAVAMFVRDEITLPELFRVVAEATETCGNSDTSLEAVFDADKAARAKVRETAHKKN